MAASNFLEQDSAIALKWLLRLRWFAGAGQVCAVSLAWGVLGLSVPLGAIGVIVALTLLSNVAILVWLRGHPPPPGVVPAVILLDVLLLSALLHFTGGPENPFASLFVVHVAMAVVMLGTGWAWVVLLTSGICFAILFQTYQPLWDPRSPPDASLMAAGQWSALILIGGLIVYFTGRIRSALHERDHQLRLAREQAARNEQLASLTTLSAGAAHELGTPLATIAVVARELEVASERCPGATDMVEDSRLIRQEVDRCRRILDRMRVDKLQSLRPSTTPIPVDELVKGLVEDLKVGERSRLRISLEPGLQTVLAPLHVLQQAVTVLIRNAFDASGDEKTVDLSIRRSNGYVVISVTDHGHGMDEQTVRRAGEPFFTTKQPGQGMGLGLFLVRLVAERAGGRFVIRSQPGVGTTGELHLPDQVPASVPP